MGQQCSNWGAPICNTKDCGVACLRTGKLQTVFEQAGGRYTVDTSYLLDLKGNKVGHIEVVSDITAQGRLKKLVGQVQEEMVALINNTREIAAASQTVSQGATEQAAALEELTSAMSEIGGQTNANAERAAQANRLAASAKESSEQGNRQMGLMVGAMNGISESSQNIAKIIKVIDDIAFQTNLLALNAAVEAARAGKYGKGFAVVAEEVRNLAGRSAKAARETSELIEGAVREVESGVAIVDQTATALGAISDSVSKVATLTKEISDATGEQAEGIAQVNSGLEQVGLVTEQNTANAEETAASSQEMSRLAQELNHLVSSMALENAGAAGEKQAAPAQNLPRAKAAKQLPPAS
ncbi:MAG: methyl-accepting chemotaxis protein [Deltaproteobacteria bacterium]|nr:methyl-accepting chemotaxis protein [Deltaproteobacteria bacterium]